MSEIQDLLKLARDCYARAWVTINPATKSVLTQMGDVHKTEAEGLQRARAITQAAFPKPGPKIG